MSDMSDKSDQILNYFLTDLHETLDACPDPMLDILEAKGLTVVDTVRPGVVILEASMVDDEDASPADKVSYEIAISIKKLTQP